MNELICKECGVELPEGTTVCPECGSPLDTDVPIPPAVPKVQYCTKCGTQLAENQSFCPNCGTKAVGFTEKPKGKKKVIIPIICIVILAIAAVLTVLFTQPKVDSITISDTAVQLSPNETFQATYTIAPEKAAKVKTTWTSSNQDIVTVDQTGLITAVSDGTATITVTAKDKMSVITVTVSPPIENITATRKVITLKANETVQLFYTITPEQAKDTLVTYKSDNEAVAKVDNEGIVTAISDGTANITLTAKDKSDTIAITVKTGPDFAAVYKKIKGDGYYCKISNDNSYITIDTNPLDLDDYSSYSAYKMVVEANRALGIPESVDEKMNQTTALDGRQTETYSGVKVSWKFHPDSGLEVMYEAE